MRGPLFRVLMKHDGVEEVPEPTKNVRVEEAPDDQQVLAALDPDNPYDWKVHGL